MTTRDPALHRADLLLAQYDEGHHIERPADRLAAAEAENETQARLLGASGERELALIARAEKAEAELEAAKSNLLAPGVMRCAKCKFGLHRVTLNVSNGAATAGHSKTETCPNGCGPLWPVTWKELSTEHFEAAERFFNESADVRKYNELLQTELAALHRADLLLAQYDEGHHIERPADHLAAAVAVVRAMREAQNIAAAPAEQLLSELYALVKGECPSLLDEDSGGDSNLAIKIETLLAASAAAGGCDGGSQS